MFKKRKADETTVEEIPGKSGAGNLKTSDGGYLGPGFDDIESQSKNQYDGRRRSTLSNMNAQKGWVSDKSSSTTDSVTTASTAGTTIKKNKCCNPDYGICGGCCYPYSCLGFSNNQSLILMAVGLLAILTGLIVGGVLLITTIMTSRRLCFTQECVVAAGEMITAMDHTIDPCQNFYQFACGGWERHHPVPAGSMGWDSFSIDASTTYFSIKELLEVESTEVDPEFVNQTRTFYRACANESAWEIAGVLPLLGELGRTGGFPLINDSWADESFDWLDSIVMMRVLYAADYLISIGVSYDSKNSSLNVIHIGEGYLPSPREYILAEDPRYRLMEIQRIITIARTLGEAMPSTNLSTASLNQSSAIIAINNTESNTTDSSTTEASTLTASTVKTTTTTTTKAPTKSSKVRSQQKIAEEDEALKLLLEASKHKQKMQMEGSRTNVVLDGIAPALSSVKVPPVQREEDEAEIATPTARKANQGSAESNITKLFIFIYNLTQITRSAVESNDLHIQYNPMTIADLQKKTDALGDSAAKINWLDYVNAVFNDANINVTKNERIIVTNPDYIYNLLKLIKRTPKDVIANFLSYMLTLNLGEETSKGFQSALTSAYPLRAAPRRIGRKEIRPWYDCSSKTSSLITEAVSYLYIQRYFLPATKQKAAEMMADVHDSFRSLLLENHWMDEETRTAGLKKVDEMVQLVGHGQNTTNATALSYIYADLPEFTDDHFENILKIARYLSRKSLAEYEATPKRESFDMDPVSINAAYSFGQNAMIIPVGILQPPFYRKNTLTALNYGAIGVVIGHEVSHGFDSSGKEVDDQGNLRSWWTDSSKETYQEKASCFAEQYSQYPEDADLLGEKAALLGYKVDGNATLGENIADNGGIRAAYRAYRRRVEQTKEDHRLPGLEAYTNEQLFFISFAQMWCTSYTLQGLKGAMLVGPHAPGPYRVKGTFHNTQQMRDAFNCPANARNENQETCEVW